MANDKKPPIKEAPEAALDPRDAEIKAMRERMEALEAAVKAKESIAQDPVLNHGVTEPPIRSYVDDLKKSMADMLQASLREYLPDRMGAISSRSPDENRIPTNRVGAVIAKDRDGKDIYRRRDNTANPFEVPPELKDRDWDFQWIRVSTTGMPDIDNQVNMQENGWRPIQANRPGWEGRFMPAGYEGHIHKGGLMLMERPKVLTDEARQEDRRKVKEQTKQQREQFGMALPAGFTNQTAKAREFSGVKVGPLERTPDTFKPEHVIEY